MQTHVAVVPDGRSCYSLRPMPSPSPPPGVRRESSAAHPPTCDPGSTAVRYRGSFTPREFSVRACAAANAQLRRRCAPTHPMTRGHFPLCADRNRLPHACYDVAHAARPAGSSFGVGAAVVRRGGEGGHGSTRPCQRDTE
jgi:hypothetical protein